MNKSDNAQTVLVTGSNGYVASWIVKYLLEGGFKVNATVRDKSNQDKVGHLANLGKLHPGKLELFNADLLNDGDFDAPMKGCDIVFHTASPFIVRGLKDPQKELIEPALKGTRNVLEAVNRTESVKRVVLTSSVAAIFSDNEEVLSQPNGIFTEAVWNTGSSIDRQPYNYSKTLAEKEAWKIVEAQDRWNLVVMNPGLVLGPSLAQASASTSLSTMLEIMDGTLRTGAPDLAFPAIDVRDVATAHIRGAVNEAANGRHILVAEPITVMQIAKAIHEAFPGKCKLPLWQVPKFIVWLIAPLSGLTRDFVKRNVGYSIKFDNQRATKELNMNFMPIDVSVASHAKQILDDGLLK